MHPSAAPDRPAPAEPDLNGALLESRRRWHAMVRLAADMAFETDRAGRFTLIEPALFLGHEAATLVGRPATGLLMGSEAGPFGLTASARDVRAWLAARDGTARCLSFSVEALRDGAGAFDGLRGIARDVTEEVGRETECQAAAQRGGLLEAVLEAEAGEAPGAAVQHMLERLVTVLQASGAAVLRAGEEDPAFRSGMRPPPSVLSLARPALAEARTTFGPGARGEPMAAVSVGLAGDAAAACLVAWRMPAMAEWDAATRAVLPLIARRLADWLALDRALRRAEGMDRRDPLTGLLNRTAFVSALGRRLERMVLSGGGGALLLADPRGLAEINARLGDEAGDAVLRAIAHRIGDEADPTALAARLDDGFALWLDGEDAEGMRRRAETIRAWVAAGRARPVTDLRIGVAMVEAEAIAAEALLARAEGALREARQAMAGWHMVTIGASTAEAN